MAELKRLSSAALYCVVSCVILFASTSKVSMDQTLALRRSPQSPSQQQRRSLVVNGEDAERDRYPYFVSLAHYGGGALIAPDIVLTAGHCRPAKRDHVQPVVGRYYSSRDDDDDDDDITSDYETFDIVEAIQHPGFVQAGPDDFILDYTILKLNASSTKPWIRINRNQHVPISNQPVTVMGMGLTSEWPEQWPSRLQQAELNYLDSDTCEQSYSSKRDLTYQNRIFPSHLCTTGGPENERDACSYDSGSPIIIPAKSPTSPLGSHIDDVLIALVSWGEGCGDPDFPGVNARVSLVSEWVDATVCNISAAPPSDFCIHHENAPWRVANSGGGNGGGGGIVLAVILLVCSLIAVAALVLAWKRQGRDGKDGYESIELE